MHNSKPWKLIFRIMHLDALRFKISQRDSTSKNYQLFSRTTFTLHPIKYNFSTRFIKSVHALQFHRYRFHFQKLNLLPHIVLNITLIQDSPNLFIHLSYTYKFFVSRHFLCEEKIAYTQTVFQPQSPLKSSVTLKLLLLSKQDKRKSFPSFDNRQSENKKHRRNGNYYSSLSQCVTINNLLEEKKHFIHQKRDKRLRLKQSHSPSINRFHCSKLTHE